MNKILELKTVGKCLELLLRKVKEKSNNVLFFLMARELFLSCWPLRATGGAVALFLMQKTRCVYFIAWDLQYKYECNFIVLKPCSGLNFCEV